MTYALIPKGTEKIYLEMWGCGPECCDTYVARIYANVKGEMLRRELWESKWYTFWYCEGGKDNIFELRQEVIEVASHYDIELVDIDDNCIWDWEGERKF